MYVCVCIDLCDCFPPGFGAVDVDMMCQVSFTPVRARDTVKLIELKHSFALGVSKRQGSH